MPTYEFRCKTCDTVFDEKRPMSESDAPARCPGGHTDTVKLLSVFASTGGRATSSVSGADQPSPSRGWAAGSPKLMRSVAGRRAVNGNVATRSTIGWCGVASSVRRAFAHDRLALPEGRDQAQVLARIRCPALFVHSATDALVPPAVGEPLPGLLRSSPDARIVVVGRPPDPPLGHCDLVVSENARRHVWPLLGEWLKALG